MDIDFLAKTNVGFLFERSCKQIKDAKSFLKWLVIWKKRKEKTRIFLKLGIK